MRNLKLLQCVSVKDKAELKHCYQLCVDYDTGHVYGATDNGLCKLDAKSSTVVWCAEWTGSGCTSIGDGISIIGLCHLADQMAVCAATSAGDLLLCQTGVPQLECVGTVDGGLHAMSWSPDMELLTLATGKGTLILMTKDFDPITEIAIDDEHIAEGEFVALGWGKKETQFHGSEGKQAARETKKGTREVFNWDDHKSQLTWRGDGQFFAVSYIHPQKRNRVVKLWTREGKLHATSEDVDGLENVLSWKPSGSIIASSQRRPNKHEIVFFEKNGLRHGEFTLPFSVNQVKVVNISWNLESTVLCVWCETLPVTDGSDNTVKTSYIMLWTRSNYHWYLKQNMEFPGDAGQRVSAVIWDPEHAYTLHVACESGQYLHYSWAWTVHQSCGMTNDDYSNVAVIDGDRLHITPMGKMIVPPPLSAYNIKLSMPIDQVIFSPSGTDFAIVPTDGTFHLYSFAKNGSGDTNTIQVGAAGGNSFNMTCTTPYLKDIYAFDLDAVECYGLVSKQHLTWLSKDELLFTILTSSGSQVLCHGKLIDNTKSIKVVCEHPIEDAVYSLTVNHLSDTIAVQLSDGTLLKMKSADDFPTPWENANGEVVSFPQPCTQMAICDFDGEEVVLGLTERFRFFVNNFEVSNNCTSFGVHNDFLLLTTHSHTCRCISKSTKVAALQTLLNDKTLPLDENVRRVERGSRIVSILAHDTKVVLQMPRGNLETINPRALILSAIKKNLNLRQYATAFGIARKHRLNLNLLYDHNPGSFLGDVAEFVKQLDSVNYINLFLTELHEEDVTTTMYAGAYDRVCRPADKAAESSKKIDIICNDFNKTLQEINSDKYLLCLLTTHVKKTEPELEAALLRIQSLKDVANPVVTAEQAMKYLLLLVDVNQLYDVALGMYDFELVVVVAERSQKDPKEYLPFLNNLKKMETNYQRYTIDRYLKRYKNALHHISKCGNEQFAECLQLVNEQHLFSEALQLYSVSSSEYKEIALAYGDYLLEHGEDEEAGIVYNRAGHTEQALQSYSMACNWRMAIIMATQLKKSPEATNSICTELAERLVLKHQHVEAACLYEQYASNIEEAIVTLVEGCHWEEALRLMYKHGRTDFIETNLKPSLLESFQNQTSLIEKLKKDFDHHRARLAIVREQKEKARLELLEADGDGVADADLFSDTSSATGMSVTFSQLSSTDSQSSRTSKSSGRSGKSRRKANRRKWTLREGSANENLALVEALHQIVSQTQQLMLDTGALLKMLMFFHHDNEAFKLQKELQEFLSIVDSAKSEIWDPEQENTNSPKVITGPDSTANAIAQAMQLGIKTDTEVRLDPEMKYPPQFKNVKWTLFSATNK